MPLYFDNLGSPFYIIINVTKASEMSAKFYRSWLK